MAVHVVGNACLDWSFRLSRLPAAGETLNASALSLDLGGKGALQALAARRTGAAVTLWTAAGRDAEGAALRARLREAGLGEEGVASVDRPTDRSVILLDAAGENAIVSAVACALAFRPERAGWLAASLPGDVLVLQNNLDPAATRFCLEAGRARGLVTVFNASPLGVGEPPPGLAAVDLAVVNRGEAEALTGAGAPEAMLRGLLALGARRALVTLGPEGAALMSEADAGLRFVAAPRVEAVDTSGAGDVFCGAIAGLLDAGLPLARAAAVAASAAALAVTRPGTAGACPSAAEFTDIAARLEASIP